MHSEPAASIWFEIRGRMDPGEENFFILCRPIQANFRLSLFFSRLHINSKIYTRQGKFFYIMHKLFYSWGKVAILKRVFTKNISRPPIASP